MRKLILGLLLIGGLIVFSAATAAAQEEDMEQLIEELEQVLLYLALHESLDTSQTGKVRSDLANIHRRMSALQDASTSASSPAGGATAPEIGAEPALPEEVRPEPADDAPLPGGTSGDSGSASGSEDDMVIEDTPLVSAESPAADLGPLPDKDGGGWTPWAGALRNVSPDGALFAGWKKDSRIDLSWGEYGEVKLDIANGDITAAWTIREAYDGNDINVNVVSGSDGNIIIQVSDDNGRHDFLLTEGGAGSLYQRTARADGSLLSLMDVASELVAIEQKTSELEAAIGDVEADLAAAEGDAAAAEPAGTAAETTIAAAEGTAGQEATAGAEGSERVEWEARYKEEVRAGSRERYPAMDWFMDQAQSGSYSSEALAVLGRFLNSDSGEGHSGAIGELIYSVNDNEKIVQFPDPRQDTTEFINFINKAYILTQSDTPFIIALYY